jgi:4-amino-4-deoxy-L-arabinose transferase-like glycosyltransferase
MKIKNSYFPLLVIVSALPLILFRDFTPLNELRYLSIADEALLNDRVFTFTNHGIPYADKPPLFLWFIMLAKLLLGSHQMWVLAMGSLLPAIVIIKIMDTWVKDELNPSNRLSAKLMLITAGLFLGTALVIRMDMLMCMFIVLSLKTFYSMYKQKGKKWDVYLFPFYVFMAIFSKGPFGLLIPLLVSISYLILEKKLRTIKFYWGWKTWLILLSLCAVWFFGVYFESGPEYLNNLLFHQTVNRGINTFHHKEPFYYYMVTFWYSLAPWSLLIFGVLLLSIIKGSIKTDLERFFLTAFAVIFIMLSMVSSKIQIYLAPAFPFMVYLTALLLQKFKRNDWLGLAVGLPAFLFSLSIFVLVYFILFKDENKVLNHTFIILGAAALSISALSSLYFNYKRKDLGKAINLLAIGILISIFIASWSLPKVNSYIGYANLSKEIKKVLAEKQISTTYMYKLKRADNLDVLLGHSFEVLKKDALLKNQIKKYILVINNDVIDSDKKDQDIIDLVKGKERHVVGKYSVIVM